jgi:integrase
MLDFEDDGLLHPLVYNGTTPDERKQFETKLYLRYKYSLSHYLRFFRDIRKRLALPVTLSFNVARHSWASLARKQGIPVSVISVGLGHTSEKTTRIYLDELDNKTVDEANEIVAGLLKKAHSSPEKINREKTRNGKK